MWRWVGYMTVVLGFNWVFYQLAKSSGKLISWYIGIMIALAIMIIQEMRRSRRR